MMPTPSSVTSSRSENSPETSYKVVRKRNRIPLSCAPCRHRKLKCNRLHPCDNCTKRGDSSSCSYAAPTTRKKGNNAHHGANNAPDDMQNRIDRLEGLVLSLMSQGPPAGGPNAAVEALAAGGLPTGSVSAAIDPGLDYDEMRDDNDDGATADESETDGVTKSFGVMKVDAEKQKTFYVGEAHWAALLNEISEVKNYFSSHRKEFEDQMEKVAATRRDTETSAGSGPALLFGSSIPPSRSEILGQLPSRYMSDILIGRYFNSFDPSVHILHGPTFQKQYNAHWADPSKTSIVWIGLMFAMMRLAMISYTREGDEPPEFRGKCKDHANNCRTNMAHCLITADYTKPHNHIIETLILHLHAEYTSNRDSEASVWVLCGMIARLAMRMGYHRDSKLFPNISAFQGEMRRRVWFFVRQADLLFSFQVALPAMIRIGDSDTELPRNIYDDEFDESSPSLPVARPSSEATPISYMIAKSRLALGFGRVLEEVNSVHSKKYEDILKIDRGMRDLLAGIPEHLRLRPMSEQTLTPVTLIMARFSLATVYHKAQIVLHRRFSKSARTNSRYAHSRRTCIDSGMQLLSFQAVLFGESRERGRMKSLRDYVNSLAMHDFLLAATILCQDLYYNRERSEVDASTPSTTVSGSSGGSGPSQRSDSIDGTYIQGLGYKRADIIQALETSKDVWQSQGDVSIEAYKAGELLKVLLRALSVGGLSGAPELGYSNNTSQTSGSNADEQTAAMTLGLLQSGGMTPNTAAMLGQTMQQDPRGLLDKPVDNYLANDPAFNAVFGAANTPSPFPGGIFGGMGDLGNNMNLDWEAWDTYMQPQTLTLDPAANLWSSNSPNNMPFNNSSSPSLSPNTDPTFGHFGAFQTQSMDNMMNSTGPTLSASTSTGDASGNDRSAGETFMGVQSPVPGGVPSWKWTVMNNKG